MYGNSPRLHPLLRTYNQEDPKCIFVPLLWVPEEELWPLTDMGKRQEISLMVVRKFDIASSFLKDSKPLVLNWRTGERWRMSVGIIV